jgi:hypothetical protein
MYGACTHMRESGNWPVHRNTSSNSGPIIYKRNKREKELIIGPRIWKCVPVGQRLRSFIDRPIKEQERKKQEIWACQDMNE